ncbi:MAG TPA: integrating conjugative element protein [Gammaproteobacteria bacterium]|nr:integrating conjugative element protein [Gammaproteobacteria bacterium]
MKRVSLMLLCWQVAATVHAGPRVLFDNGQTRPLPAAPAPAQPPTGHTKLSPTPDDNAILPIRTPELSVGRVERRATPASPYALRPTCVIGADPMSLAWLRSVKPTLIERGAYCWLVQAETPDDLSRVADVADGLIVIPAPGAILQQAFGIRHYPVLISPRWIEQ